MQYIRDLIPSKTNAVIASIGITALTATSGFYMWRRAKLQISGDFTHVGCIETVIIYPIKSLPGVEVAAAEITKVGLRCGQFRDRSFILVKETSGMFITMRQEPKLALLKLSLEENHLLLDDGEMETLRIPLKSAVDSGDIVRKYRVYGQDVEGLDCGDHVAQWFQSYLGKPGFRLLQYVPSFKPRKLLTNLIGQFNPGQMLYHDDCAYLFLSKASVDDLNERLEEKVSFKNFRPNFLITGCKAFAEDNMKYGKIGDSVFLFMSQCSRCILTTVNPETGIKTEKEPLVTLRTYRLAPTEELKKQYGKSPLFGVYMGTRTEGVISVGDNLSAIPF